MLTPSSKNVFLEKKLFLLNIYSKVGYDDDSGDDTFGDNGTPRLQICSRVGRCECFLSLLKEKIDDCLGYLTFSSKAGF